MNKKQWGYNVAGSWSFHALYQSILPKNQQAE
jgi:hypothetical protein